MSISRVAKAANVSYATAWRVINNHPSASPRVTDAVRAAMRAVGYADDTTAVAPAPGRRGRGRPPRSEGGIRTSNVALLHLRPGTGISSEVLAAVQRELVAHNLNMIFAHAEEGAALPPAVRRGDVDGILGYGQLPTGCAALRRVPAVWLMSRSDEAADEWGDRVKPDHWEIGRLAARAAIARGHRHVAVMNPDPSSVIYRHRCQSFAATVSESGSGWAVVRPISIKRPGASAAEAAKELVEQFTAAPVRPTAAFVPVDRVTIHVHRELERRGVGVGSEVELLSCDNEADLLSLVHPRPMSVDLNRGEIARLAVERLLWRMRNGRWAPQVVMTVTPSLAVPDDRRAPPVEGTVAVDAPPPPVSWAEAVNSGGVTNVTPAGADASAG